LTATKTFNCFQPISKTIRESNEKEGFAINQKSKKRNKNKMIYGKNNPAKPVSHPIGEE
jgi:hypothetical protein